MANYLEDAAAALRKADAAITTLITPGDKRDALLRIADGYTRLAAIERGLLPPEMACRCPESQA